MVIGGNQAFIYDGWWIRVDSLRERLGPMREIGRVWIVLLTVLALAVSPLVLTGCGSDAEEPAATEEPADTEQPADTEEPADTEHPE